MALVSLNIIIISVTGRHIVEVGTFLEKCSYETLDLTQRVRPTLTELQNFNCKSRFDVFPTPPGKICKRNHIYSHSNI